MRRQHTNLTLNDIHLIIVIKFGNLNNCFIVNEVRIHKEVVKAQITEMVSKNRRIESLPQDSIMAMNERNALKYLK